MEKTINISIFDFNSSRSEVLVGIYKITSPTKKIYIGQSCDILKRFYIYKKLHCKKQTHLYNSFLKYGIDKHKFEILTICKEEELNNLEEKYSKDFKSTDREYGLNLRKCGLQNKHSQESKLKMSLSSLGKRKSEQARLKMSETRKEICKEYKFFLGKKHSEKSKIKMSLAKKGKPSKRKGIKLTEDCKKKISETLKSREYSAWNKGIKMTDAQTINMRKPKSEQSKINMRIAKLGKKQSLEHIQKRISSRKIFMTDETKRILSEKAKLRCSLKKNSFYGKTHNEETKRKMSDKRKLFWENIKQEKLSMIF